MTTCRICYEPGYLISVCHCTGSCGAVHFDCIQKWIMLSKRTRCEICHHLYTYPGLRFPLTVNQARKKNSIMLTFTLGCIHGFTLWIDSNLSIKNIGIYLGSCFMFNTALMFILYSLYRLDISFRKSAIYFYIGIIVGNMPGHMFSGKITWHIGACYAFNTFCLGVYLTMDMCVFSHLREPTHQNNIVIDDENQNR